MPPPRPSRGLVRRDDADAATRCLTTCEEWLERFSERGSRVTHLGLGLVGRDLQLQLEATCLRELLEEVIEHGNARRDAAHPRSQA